MITLQDCLDTIMETDDCLKASKLCVPKFRKMLPLDVASILLVLTEEYEYEDFVVAALHSLDRMPIEFFDQVLDFDEKLAELYN